MNIVQQLVDAHDMLEAANADDGAAELAWVLGHQPDEKVSRVVESVASMRRAMDDPSCVDVIDPGQRVPGSTLLSTGRLIHRDPTADAAIVKNTARSQHTQLVKAIDECHRACLAGKWKQATGKAYTVSTAVARWLPRLPTMKERQEASRDLDPGCLSCARTEVVRGTKRWEPASRPGTLCDWCYRWKLRTSEVPSVEVVEQHHRGRVRVSA